MTEATLWHAALRAMPLAMCLPLPSLPGRVALGLVLVAIGAGVPGIGEMSADRIPLELALGLALGLLTSAPLWAARWAGALIGSQLLDRRESVSALYTTVAWLAFCAVKGPSLVVASYIHSYSIAPGMDISTLGSKMFVLVASLALPSLIAIAVVELCAGVVQRFERGAGLPVEARAIAHAARPVLVLLLLAGSVAALATSVAGSVIP